LAEFSTRGPWVRISAPGDNIISTVPGGAYATWSGTSMAAPSVAGVAALVRARQTTLGAAAVTDHLVATARQICSPAPVRLDAATALGLPAPKGTGCRGPFLPSVRGGR
ncbi:MAG TPA: S8 family serine peptidase, partial [Chloroflexaceae bacterium]|nr:S8 family serine peptidase [Chloroflexaceae bacterium]